MHLKNQEVYYKLVDSELRLGDDWIFKYEGDAIVVSSIFRELFLKGEITEVDLEYQNSRLYLLSFLSRSTDFMNQEVKSTKQELNNLPEEVKKQIRFQSLKHQQGQDE